MYITRLSRIIKHLLHLAYQSMVKVVESLALRNELSSLLTFTSCARPFCTVYICL